jgi:hypothetical protein
MKLLSEYSSYIRDGPIHPNRVNSSSLDVVCSFYTRASERGREVLAVGRSCELDRGASVAAAGPVRPSTTVPHGHYSGGAIDRLCVLSYGTCPPAGAYSTYHVAWAHLIRKGGSNVRWPRAAWSIDRGPATASLAIG